MIEIPKDRWELIYNTVFKVYPPSNSLNIDIYYKTKNGDEQHFKSVNEFLSFLCVTIGDNFQYNDIKYKFRDDIEYEKANTFLNNVIDKIKKREV